MSRSLETAVLVFLFITASCASSPPGPPADVAARAEASKLLASGDYRGVLEVLEPVVRGNSGDSRARSMLGEALWRLGRRAEAITQFEESLRVDYSDYRTHMMLAQVLSELGKRGRALTEFELAVELAPGEPIAHYNYGLALYRMGKKEDALLQWTKAFDLDKENSRYAAALGMGYAGVDDEKALFYFERAAATGEDSPSFHNNYGLLLERLGRTGAAATHFRSAVRGDPGNDAYRFNLAAVYMKTGELERALVHWKKLVDKNPRDRRARIYMARALLDLERYDAAVSALEGEVEKWPKKASGRGGVFERSEGPRLDDALSILAMAWRGKGNLEKAHDYIVRALELEPDDPAHLIDYGVIEAESGNIDEALRAWRKALESDPGNETARSNIEKYERR